MAAIVMVTNVGDEAQAQRIAHELVSRRQVACVNILPGVTSFYRWEGKVCRDAELLLIIKTLKSAYGEVAATIRELHSYDLPEILAFDIPQGDPGYLDWIAQNVG